MSYASMSVESAADAYAEDYSQAEAWAAYVESFVDDAADETLCEQGNAAYLVGEDAAIEALFLQLLWADKESAFLKVCALRDALRQTAIKRWPSDVMPRARKMAQEQAGEI